MKIVITGTTSGIGKALALYYAQPGVTLGLLGRRQALLTITATACTARGATVMPAALDVRDGAAMRAYAEQFVMQAHANIFAVNVIGLLNILLPFMPQMIQQKSGQLVAIASIAGFRALPGSTTYAATKVAVRALMEGYGWELRRHGIATTTINPGFVVSEMTAHNQFRMPFLVPTDIAAGKIARAIQRRRRNYTFPWPMACLAHLLPFIPGTILGRLTPPGTPSSL